MTEPAPSFDTAVLPVSGPSDHTYDGSRSPATLKWGLAFAIEQLKTKTKKLNTMQKKATRLQRRVTSMEKVLEELQDKQLVSKDATVVFRNAMPGVPLALNTKAIRNSSVTLTEEQNPSCLVMFALSFQFYSTKAYKYVRETFALGLPHPSTLEPGTRLSTVSPDSHIKHFKH